MNQNTTYQNVFKRYEIKYLLTHEQRDALMDCMENYMQPDAYGISTICNVYFDTPDKLLIRRSLEGSVYKEKLRLRSYGLAKSDSTAFVELKKKYKGVVYKRRMDMPLSTAEEYLYMNKPLDEKTQISSEIDYFKQFYGDIQPAAFISYERQAFYSTQDPNFRMTFDKNILWRDYNLDLTSGIYGSPLLENGTALLEVKTAGAIPLWLSHEFGELQVYKTSFSKYGNAYKEMLEANLQGKHFCGGVMIA